MTVSDLVREAGRGDEHFQLHVNAFLDEFRRADAGQRHRMIEPGLTTSGPIEGLIAAVVSALCRETGTPAPQWIREVHSPQPFFVVPAAGFALRVRLMIESPAPFRIRNVFVPENYLSRA
jgi:hypothetical protein